MKTILACIASWSVLAIGMAAATPARPRYEPPPAPPAPPDIFDFRGTTWFGKTYEGNDWTIIFHPDGKVTNIDGPNTYKNSGNWKAIGNNMYMDLNGKYYEYRAVLVGDVLQGDSSNITGLRWKTNFRRIASREP